MTRSEADHSVFYRHSALSFCIYLVVYVDDIVVTGNDQDGIINLKQHLFQHFQTKDLGRLKYFLGIEVAQSSSDLRDNKQFFLDHPGAVPLTTAQGEELRKSIGASACIECSAKTQQNVKAVFDAAIKVVLQPPRQKKEKEKGSKNLPYLVIAEIIDKRWRCRLLSMSSKSKNAV
ncbi:PREDICTED: rac-like GTP-binding protein RHO1 [Nicotiana attenuata]|uniref:rac-like GTP-binding protein RHO1 n=1 Tax=Nicotiana attenuata TaxID=49451 RepID=UPI000905561B|nr:PREDICTED: rac-like GTP-binding protein RHO1 [Nicotiana attenuata]